MLLLWRQSCLQTTDASSVVTICKVGNCSGVPRKWKASQCTCLVSRLGCWCTRKTTTRGSWLTDKKCLHPQMHLLWRQLIIHRCFFCADRYTAVERVGLQEKKQEIRNRCTGRGKSPELKKPNQCTGKVSILLNNTGKVMCLHVEYKDPKRS